ncbi:MAG TPA: haloacid dehalogenase-like hydrolase [Kiritimatiellia bacterium]|nr:haloacid dehalogenase-like hydrolase [Kiritimatiellia bacterium]
MIRPAAHKAIVILDFDGTLYRGLCPALCRGIANADLLVALCLINLSRPRCFFRLLREATRLQKLQQRLARAYTEKRLSLSSADGRLIRFFTHRIMMCCTPTVLDQAAALVSRLCYPSAWRALSAVRGDCDFAVVSKSFHFLLEKVRQRAATRGVHLQVVGTRVRCGGAGWRIEVPMTRAEKALQVRELLMGRAYDRAVVIGDTEDDIGMRDAAVKVLGAESVTFIALNVKDNEIKSAADVSCPSWRQVGAFLRGWVSSVSTGTS